MKLTETQIKKIKPQDTPKRYFDGGGLYLEVRPNGSRYWRYKFRFQKKEKLLAIGVYPDVSLKDARIARAHACELLDKGIDPTAEKNNGRISAQADEQTFERIAREWMQLQKDGWAQSHYRTVAQRLEANVFPFIGQRPISDIQPIEVLDTIKIMESRGVRESAHKTMSICSMIFRYAVASCIIPSDPTRDLRGALAPVVRGQFAAITTRLGAGQLMRAIQGFEGFSLTRLLLQLHAYTFCRPGEIRAAEWAEIDMDSALWTIPAERMKGKREHLVPLSHQALKVLKDAQPISGHGRFVFPSIRSAARPMSNNTANAAIRRMGYGKDEMTAHGFRAMASTLLNEQGYDPDVIERQLAHVETNKVRAAYHRAQYLDERRKMMQEWADLLDSLAQP
jgi:integrase